ncbi:MAG: carbon-nitrogen hydrolase family protein [Ruminococcaceae bacterium]|nr:carbon-nitrogen hydrolase family protein [Oscillospiraceae bacterium]
MMKLKIALLQLLPKNTLSEQLELGKSACEKAKQMGADIALFPEMWSCGYRISETDPNSLAVSANGEFVNAFGELAKSLNMAIGITFLEKFSPLPRNSLTLFDRHGERKFTYAKVHTCDFGDERVLTHGNEFFVCNLDTECGDVRVGAMICYDREFPESARILMLKGAEVILVPNACPMEINRLSQLRARAYENMTAIATCNYPAPHPDCNGHSSAFDGIAYLPDMPGSRDMCVLESGEQEGIYLSELDMDMIREYRSREVHGDSYRRPELYKQMISEVKNPPFIRADFRK